MHSGCAKKLKEYRHVMGGPFVTMTIEKNPLQYFMYTLFKPQIFVSLLRNLKRAPAIAREINFHPLIITHARGAQTKLCDRTFSETLENTN